MGFFSRLWERINPREMTDSEINELNSAIAHKMNKPTKVIHVYVISSTKMRDILRSNSKADPWGLAYPHGTILVIRKWRHIVAHEIAHVYGANEPLARQFDDFKG